MLLYMKFIYNLTVLPKILKNNSSTQRVKAIQKKNNYIIFPDDFQFVLQQ